MPKVQRIHPVEEETIVDAWLTATSELLYSGAETRSNVVVSIDRPTELSDPDRAACELVDGFLRNKDLLPLVTVANTILPGGFYLDGGAEGVYDDFPKSYAQTKSGWGTYAGRLFAEKITTSKGTMSRGQRLVEKLRENMEGVVKMRAAYEADILDTVSFEDLSIYRPEEDMNRGVGQPCLTHLSFKLHPKERLVSLTALYRSQFLIQKALGNYIGLGQLLHFVAHEAGLGVGHLVCHATQAELDLNADNKHRKSRWSKDELSRLLSECRDAQAMARRQAQTVSDVRELQTM